MEPLTLAPLTDEYRQHMRRVDARYTDEYIQAAWEYNQLYSLTHSAEAGQAILDYCREKNYCGPLVFNSWHDGYVLALDAKGRRYVVLGSFWSGRFVLRGIVKERRKGKAFHYLCNGQASTNAIQLTFIGERDAVQFPQFQQIIQRFNTLMQEIGNVPKETTGTAT